MEFPFQEILLLTMSILHWTTIQTSIHTAQMFIPLNNTPIGLLRLQVGLADREDPNPGEITMQDQEDSVQGMRGTRPKKPHQTIANLFEIRQIFY
jgi:hypothetical protein